MVVGDRIQKEGVMVLGVCVGFSLGYAVRDWLANID